MSNLNVKSAIRFANRKIKRLYSSKPIFLNYPAATLCNQKCVMCNIHEKKKAEDIGVAELQPIISDPLFNNIESLGFSGGEPFMKKDLLEVFELICSKLENLQHYSINTNGRIPKRFQKTLPHLKEIAAKHGKQLNIVFSMDGVGELNNEVRGVEDAWVKLNQSVDIAKNEGIVPSVLMTIHNRNWFDVFNVYSFCIENDLLPYFGVATVIERLGNETGHSDFEMTKMQKLYVAEFIDNLANDPMQKVNKRIWYSKLLRQLAYNEKRTANCIAKDSGVYLSDKGEVSYCGVYDKELSKNTNETYWSAFRSSKNRKNIHQEMVDKHCNTCMHDYQSEPTVVDLISTLIIPNKVKKAFQINKYRSVKFGLENNRKTAFLFGWFGTETIGDKAIYSEIIHRLREEGIFKFTILSLRKYYTERTILELGFELSDFDIVELEDISSVTIDCCIAVYCGGPLMGFADLFGFLHLSKELKKRQVPMMVFGAGFGPFKNSLYEKAALKFISNASGTFLRDRKSAAVANVSDFASDPAHSWVQRNGIVSIKSDIRLGISLRELSATTYSYGVDFNDILNKISIVCKQLIDENKIDSIVLVPMNTHYVGGDDRKVLRKLKLLIDRDLNIRELHSFYTPQEILNEVSNCSALIGTRFHSCVFSLGLNIPTVGIEYTTGGGKIESLFNDYGIQKYCIAVEKLNSDTLKEKVINSLDDGSLSENLSNVNAKTHEKYQSIVPSMIKSLM